jgi:hypothetical protein
MWTFVPRGKNAKWITPIACPACGAEYGVNIDCRWCMEAV